MTEEQLKMKWPEQILATGIAIFSAIFLFIIFLNEITQNKSDELKNWITMGLWFYLGIWFYLGTMSMAYSRGRLDEIRKQEESE